MGGESLKNNFLWILSITFFLIFAQFLLPANSLADHIELTKGKKVLVVASNHKGNKWCDDIVNAIEHELFGAELTVFYMDTKRNLGGAEEKAKEAFKLYQKLQPDAVITVDDIAQEYFVVPYLRDKVKTPIFFCGVNEDASRYNFPASNVTGVLEMKHYRESISFAQMIEPKVRSIAVLYSPSPSNKVNIAQIEKEKETYSASIIGSIAVTSVAEVQKALVDYSSAVDAILVLDLTGIIDENNKQIEGDESISLISNTTDLVTIVASDWEVKAGALCGVTKSGEEQGVLVTHQLLAHWEGKEIKNLPLVQNKNGQRYINFNTLNKLKIKLRPVMVIGTKIISET